MQFLQNPGCKTRQIWSSWKVINKHKLQFRDRAQTQSDGPEAALLKGTKTKKHQNRHVPRRHLTALDVLDSELWRTRPLHWRAPSTLAQSRHPQTGTGSAYSTQKSPCQVSGVKIFIGNPAFKHHLTFLLIRSYSNSSNRPIVSQSSGSQTEVLVPLREHSFQGGGGRGK